MTATDEIDAYLARLPDDQRRALEALRRSIAESAPEAVEGLSYGAPAFRYRDRPLVAYGAAKGHSAFYPMSPPLIEAHADALAAFDTAKGTIRFAPDRPIPHDLLTAIVGQRIAELDAAAARPRR